MEYKSINLNGKFKLFNDYWSPKIIGKINNYFLKAIKVEGDFTWHKHDETDELFIVNKGVLRIDFKDGYVKIKEGEFFIVEKGKEHKPFAEKACEVLTFEPETTVNTGNIRNEYTKENLDWI